VNHHNFYRASKLLLPLLLVFICTLPQGTSAQNSKKEQLQNAINEAEDDANDEGDPSKKIMLFKKAANLLEKYISKYEKDIKSTTYLRLHYRLGVDRENANQLGAARNEYTICQKSPALNATDALYDGEPISALVVDRLAALDIKLRQVEAPPNGVTTRDNRTTIRGGSHTSNDNSGPN
jgi:predicted Zn-dependent protease